MFKSFEIILFFCVLLFGMEAQNIKKELLPKTWYCNEAAGADLLQLSADNLNNPKYELRFTSTGRLIQKATKKRGLDSSCTYAVKKKGLVFFYELRDSVKTFEYQVKKIPKKKAYLLRLTYSFCYVKRKGDDTIVMDKFILMNQEKRKIIEKEEELTVFSQKKALRNDSINLAVWGQFVGYITDTLLIDSDQYVEHNFYRKYTDSMHYLAPLLLDTVVRIKVPVKEITGIYNQREPLSTITTNATLLALGAGLACVATSFFTKDSSVGNVFAQAGVVSFLTIPVSVSVGMVFSKQKFRMSKNRHEKKTWQIGRHMPGTVITKRTQNKLKVLSN